MVAIVQKPDPVILVRHDAGRLCEILFANAEAVELFQFDGPTPALTALPEVMEARLSSLVERASRQGSAAELIRMPRHGRHPMMLNMSVCAAPDQTAIVSLRPMSSAEAPQLTAEQSDTLLAYYLVGSSDLFIETGADFKVVKVMNSGAVHPAAKPLDWINADLRQMIEPHYGDGQLVLGAFNRQEPFKNVSVVITHHGFRFHCRCSGNPVFDDDGRFHGYRGSVSDVSDHENLRRALNEAERTALLLRVAMDSSPVNLTISDATKPDLPLLFVNQAFCDTTGYTYSEVIGRNCRFLQGEDTDPLTIDRIRQAVRQHKSIEIEILNYRKDGDPFWNLLSIAPVRDNNGVVTAFVGVQKETTAERKATERERQRQKMEALGSLAGGVAHEINNLLQPSLAFPELIAEDLPADAEEAREWLELIRGHAEQAKTIVSDILAFSRSDKRQLQALDFPLAVHQALDFVRGIVPPSINIVRSGALAQPWAPVTVIAEPNDLKHLLANLIGNAAQAMASIGDVQVSLEPRRDVVILRVSDQGCGMDQQTRARIFEPFFTTKDVGEGTGLGLSIVYGAVQRWGGQIEVDSEVGVGTSFQISLPRAGEETACAPQAA